MASRKRSLSKDADITCETKKVDAKRSISNDADISMLHKEWDEVSCPICMDHPHNAVLILCSSHDKGCRSFICDTSYRHSNCLDRFKKLVSDNNTSSPSPVSFLPGNSHNLISTSESNLIEADGNHDLNENETGAYVEVPGGPGENSINTGDMPGSSSSLKCPLCRGSVRGWEVLEEARQYLNLKPRSCSRESCSFSGNYRELRRHARRAHPRARPSDIDPSRERAWQRLEHQREYGDIVSAIRSAIPGAVVFGDYAIENGDRLPGERDRVSSVEGNNNGHWWTAFFLFQMIGSMDSASNRRGGGRSRVPTRHRRRLLWGENLLGLQDEDEEDDDDDDDNDPFDLNMMSDTGEDPSQNPRRRRRLTQYRSDEDQS